MGNLQAQYELTAEEMERFEMEVDEDFNPTADKSIQQSRQEYLQRQRNREADELRLKYLGPNVPKGPDHNQHGPPEGITVQSKPQIH